MSLPFPLSLLTLLLVGLSHLRYSLLQANDLYKAREKVRDEPDWLSLAEFLELRNHFVPILYRWFLENFPDPNLWYWTLNFFPIDFFPGRFFDHLRGSRFRAKLQYAHSVAVMSMFGYIVGYPFLFFLTRSMRIWYLI